MINKRLFFLSLFTILFTLFLAGCSHGASWTDWQLEKAPTCTEKGKEYRCLVEDDSVFEYREIDALGHSFEEWEIVVEPTYESTGLRRRVCDRCGLIEEEEIPVLDYMYVLTCRNDADAVQNYYLPLDGTYKLSLPQKEGFTFVKYVDENGDDFALEGNVNRDAIVHAVWEILPTTSFQEFKSRIENGANKILLANDFEISDTVYIDHSVDIYCDSDILLTRSSNYNGFLFVVGKNTLEENINIKALGSEVHLYTTDGAKLILDGNKENITNVYGSAFLITNSCIVDVDENVIIQNFKKTNNYNILFFWGV